jgi:hypothetical protein
MQLKTHNVSSVQSLHKNKLNYVKKSNFFDIRQKLI